MIHIVKGLWAGCLYGLSQKYDLCGGIMESKGQFCDVAFPVGNTDHCEYILGSCGHTANIFLLVNLPSRNVITNSLRT